MTPSSRIATRLLLGQGALVLVCLALAGALLVGLRWVERDRRALVEDALPRFSEMLAVSRLGDALAETAGALAAAADGEDRRTALAAMAQAREALAAHLAALDRHSLEPATRQRLEVARADMAEALDTLDSLVERRLALQRVAGGLNARLGLMGDLLPEMERALLSGGDLPQLGVVIDVEDLDFPPGPSSTAAANAIRAWARNAQVAVGMMLAASGAAETADLDYLALRTEESLRRAGAASREADRAAMPVMEAVQADLAAIAEGVNGEDSVFRVRRQRLTMEQNTPAVLARGRQASDRLTAAVAQVVADIDQNSAVRAAQMERAGLLWRFGAWGLAGLGVVVALWSALLLWGGVRGRLRRLTAAVVAARDDAPVVLGPREGRPDEIGGLARAVERLDSERRRLAGARRDQASRLAAVFATLPDAVLLLAADHTVADASPAAEGLLGRSVSALLGRPLENVLPAPAAAAVADAVAAALARPEAPPTAVAVSLPDPAAAKALRPATVFAGAFADPAGPGPVGVAVIRVGAALSGAGVEGDRSDAATGDGDDGTPDVPADPAGGLSHAS